MTRAERIQSRARVRSRAEVPRSEQNIFRDDLGIRMTNTQYGAYSEDESNFQEEYSDVKGKLDTASGQISDIDIDKEYAKAQKGFTKLNIVYGPGNIEGTYLIPKEMVDHYNTKVFNNGKGTYTGSYGEEDATSKEYFVDVRPRGSNNPFGKELHDAMGGAEKEVRDEFYSTYGPQLDKDKADALATLQGEYDYLDKVKTQRETRKSDAKEDYESRASARGSALAGAI